MSKARRQSDNLITGVICIDKPSGMTSHDVVRRVRRLSQQRRVGHAGTLDPMATGVLLVCLGRATRISEYLVEGTKAYRAQVRLGQETNTWDADGEIIAERPVPDISSQSIQEALKPFSGDIEQIPPMFSAIKQDGRPLYKLARKGVQVERKPRHVTIHSLSLISLELPFLTLDVVCSKGTYVRSLAHDLGDVLGIGAHLSALVRTRVGSFGIEDAVPLEQLEQTDDLEAHLQSMSVALGHMDKVLVSAKDTARLVHGQTIEVHCDGQELLAAVDSEGSLVAVLSQVADQRGFWRPVKVLQVS